MRLIVRCHQSLVTPIMLTWNRQITWQGDATSTPSPCIVPTAYGFLVLTDRSERYKGGIPAVHHIFAVANASSISFPYTGERVE